MIIDNSGNVGIGTKSPNQILHAHDPTESSRVMAQFTNGTTGSTSTDGVIIGVHPTSANVELWNWEDTHITFATNNNARMRITNDGNVGIGTVSPEAKLHIEDSSGEAFRIISTKVGNSHIGWLSKDNYFSYASTGKTFFRTYDGSSYSNKVVIDSVGSVGIGTTSPDEYSMLHVMTNGSGNLDNVTIESPVSNKGFGLKFKGATDTWVIGQNIGNYSDGRFQIINATPTDYVFTILQDGFVGIGTTSPGSELDVKGTLRLSGSTSGYVGLKGAASAGSTTFTLPSADGTSGQVLSTNGSGTLSWSSVSGGSLANATTTIGTGSADAKLASNGNYDLVLQTGNSTTGTITISDGANGNIAITPNGTGEVDISKVDIDGGAIDGTAIGANSASTGAFSTLSATGTVTVGAGANEFTISESSDDITLKNTISDKDVIFNVNDGGTATEVMRLDGSEGSVLVASAQKVQFRDTGLMINSSADGQLDIDADTEVEITTTTVDLNGALDVSGTSTLAGAVTANAGVVVDNITIDGTEIDLSSGDLTLDVAGDIYLNADGGNILFQDGSADLMEIDANSRISLSNNDSGTSNTLFGKSAGASLDAGSNYNVFVGEGVSDATMDDATYNVGVGYSVLSALTSGDYNVGLGSSALTANTTGTRNIAIGNGALDAPDTENDNLAIGYDALGGAIAGGEYNVAIGNYSLDANTSGDYNTALGYASLGANTTASYNTAIGWQSMLSTAGAGTFNTGVGARSLETNTTGDDNTAVGVNSMFSNSTGNENTGVGRNSLYATTGSYNTSLGWYSGNEITSGTYNTVIGHNASASGATAVQQIVIGAGATGTGDNEIALGNTSISAIKAQVTSITGYSDKRIKKDIRDTDLGLAFVNKLRPVKYRWKNPADYPAPLLEERYKNGQDPRPKNDEAMHDGLVAQEVKASLDKMGLEWSGWSKNDSDGKQGIQYGALVVPLIKAVQELSAKIDRLESQLEANSAEVSASQ